MVDTSSYEVLTNPATYRDKAADWYDYYDCERRREICEILNNHPEIIEEHAANPIGYRNHHSPMLQRVLNYFRSQPVLGKYYIYTEEPWSRYLIAVNNELGESPDLLKDQVFASEEEAMHGVFLKRIEDIQE